MGGIVGVVVVEAVVFFSFGGWGGLKFGGDWL